MKKREKVWNSCKLIAIYVILYVVSTLIWILSFHTPLLKNLNVLMYKGMVLIVASSALAAAGMLILKHFWWRKLITVKDVILLFCGCCCVNMVLFTLIPVTVERSVSVFMLSYMEENSEVGFTQDEVKEIFIEKYVDDYGAFEKRFHEQMVTGSISENSDGTYSITERGKVIVDLFRVVAKCFNTDQRLIYPNEN